MTTGHGTVVCQHGTYPVPAPATLLLVRDCPVVAGDIEAERLTPTGAAILTFVADSWGPMPSMRPAKVAYGAGDREFDDHPNFLRTILGTDLAAPGPELPSRGEVLVLETTIDDVPPQSLAYACERLFELGAYEVFTSAVTMKKGRSGHLITVLGRPDQFDELATCLTAETSTLGLRYRIEQRLELERSSRKVRTPWGAVRVKIGRVGDREVRAWPEYEDCAAVARKRGLTLSEVQRAALEAYKNENVKKTKR
jgi:hypothetical protein